MNLELFVQFIEAIVVLYALAYTGSNLFIILLGFGPAREELRSLAFDDLDQIDGRDSSAPPVCVMVPAYNEAVGIVDSLQTLIKTDYPRLEIVVINDGSRDETAARVREAFGMRRRDLPRRHEVASARIRGLYEATVELPPQIDRFVLVDKENGGKADAFNAALNICLSPYVVTVDADSLLDPAAIKQVVRILQADPSIMAVGGQVGIVNACDFDGEKLTRLAVPSAWIPLFQTLEYLRAFTVMRMGFSRMNALLILSGAFMVLRRETAVELGGFLTGRSPSRLLEEYAGPGADTICEDMEIVVRMQRYSHEAGLRGRIVHSPMPVCWTECPDNLDFLSKQRRRWHRGLFEILRHNRVMFMNPDYGKVGLFAFPYFVLFEGFGPFVEAAGFLLLPLMALGGILEIKTVLLINGIAIAGGVLQSLVAVLCATWVEPASPAGKLQRSLLGIDRWKDRLLLLMACFVSELGYRQLTLIWRLHGGWDYLRGRSGWDKFERKGFRKVSAMLLVGLGLLMPTMSYAQTGRLHAAVGSEHSPAARLGWWSQVHHSWNLSEKRKAWLGGFHLERGSRWTAGILAGWADQPRKGMGYGLEMRVAPRNPMLPRWQFSAEGEASVHRRATVSALLRHSAYSLAEVIEVAPGVVLYYPLDHWFALRFHWLRTGLGGGKVDRELGFSLNGSRIMGRLELRGHLSRQGEAYLALGGSRLDRVRSVNWGGQLRWTLADGSVVHWGTIQRRPERGANYLYMSVGMERPW